MLTKQHMGSYFAWKGPVNEDHAKKSKFVPIKMSMPFSIDISSPCGIWSKRAKAVFSTPRLENWLVVVYFTAFFFLPFVSTRICMPLVIFFQLFSSRPLWKFMWAWGLCTSKTPTDISTSTFHSHLLCLTVWHIAALTFHLYLSSTTDSQTCNLALLWHCINQVHTHPLLVCDLNERVKLVLNSDNPLLLWGRSP